jgi:hypothetical protein
LGHQQTKSYTNRELANYRETLSQTEISLSSKGIIDLEGHRGQTDTASISRDNSRFKSELYCDSCITRIVQEEYYDGIVKEINIKQKTSNQYVA